MPDTSQAASSTQQPLNFVVFPPRYKSRQHGNGVKLLLPKSHTQSVFKSLATECISSVSVHVYIAVEHVYKLHAVKYVCTQVMQSISHMCILLHVYTISL